MLVCAVALERTSWQQPVSAGAISERGKLQVRLSGYLVTAVRPILTCDAALPAAHRSRSNGAVVLDTRV